MPFWKVSRATGSRSTEGSAARHRVPPACEEPSTMTRDIDRLTMLEQRLEQLEQAGGHGRPLRARTAWHHRPRRAASVLGLTFALLLAPAITLAVHQFGDVPDSNPFHSDIAALVSSGVTAGCGSGNYCPKADVTREQMAAMLNRLGALGPGKTPVVNAATAVEAQDADTLDGLDSEAFMRGYEVVSETNAVASGRSFHSVSCSEGNVPIGGGWHDVYNDTADIAIPGEIGPISSYPTESAWSVTYWNALASAHDVTFYVVCAAAD